MAKAKTKSARPAPSICTLSNKEFYAFIVKYVRKNYERWRKKYPNIVGIDLVKKTKGGKVINRYAITFHVVSKTDAIAQKQRIPKYISVKYKSWVIQVPTDVIPTGRPKLLYIHPGQNVFQFNDYMYPGSVGPIVFKSNLPHILTNMHVAGHTYLVDGIRQVSKHANPHLPPDLSCRRGTRTVPFAYLTRGRVDDEVDAAIGLIPPPLYDQINEYIDYIDVSNPMSFPPERINPPFPVEMFGARSGPQKMMAVSAVANQTWTFPFGQHTIYNLIKLSPRRSTDGDSGSAVFDPVSKSIIGIVIGADNNFTYVIPYSPIKVALGLD